jgi:cell fate (sporulation/competence/biofilm development) regulator YlbF (YheA/YmcA/DUF963 family)
MIQGNSENQKIEGNKRNSHSEINKIEFVSNEGTKSEKIIELKNKQKELQSVLTKTNELNK